MLLLDEADALAPRRDAHRLHAWNCCSHKSYHITPQEAQVLLLDEADALAPRRDAHRPHEARVVAQLLTLLDGAASAAGAHSALGRSVIGCGICSLPGTVVLAAESWLVYSPQISKILEGRSHTGAAGRLAVVDPHPPALLGFLDP